jgi:hypothetical protein
MVFQGAHKQEKEEGPHPPERIALMMSPMCHPNQKPHLHMLVVPMILIWKMLIWNSILKHTKDRSRDGPEILIKRHARSVLMKK